MPNNNITDVLLRGIDKLNELFGNVDETSLDVNTEIADCEKLLHAGHEKSRKKPDSPVSGERVFNLDHYNLEGIKASGHYIFEFTIDLALECGTQKRTPSDLRKELESAGKVLDSSPDLEGMKLTVPEGKSILCTVLFASVLDDPEILADGLGISPLNLFCYSPKDIKKATGPIRKKESKKGKAANRLKRDGEGAESKIADRPAAVQKDRKTITKGETAEMQAPIANKESTDSSVRISVTLLDKLMNLASELVLVRNRNMQAASTGDLQQLITVNQQLNVIRPLT